MGAQRALWFNGSTGNDNGRGKMVDATQKEVGAPICNRPLAAEGLLSYRYRGTYGYVMIGAKDVADALSEAMRSTGKESKASRLEAWDGEKYVPVL